VDESDEERRGRIGAELSRLEESAMWSAQGQFEQSKRWRGVNLGLGVPTSVLAAVSGATALADVKRGVVAGVLALLAAGFGAILTTVNASQRQNKASAGANAYLEIQTAARQYRQIDLPYDDVDEARAHLAELTARRDEQNKTSEPISKAAYKKARKNIESGGQSYAADQEPGNQP
jgi:uncharacterized protein (DUF1800 family)